MGIHISFHRCGCVYVLLARLIEQSVFHTLAIRTGKASHLIKNYSKIVLWVVVECVVFTGVCSDVCFQVRALVVCLATPTVWADVRL